MNIRYSRAVCHKIIRYKQILLLVGSDATDVFQVVNSNVAVPHIARSPHISERLVVPTDEPPERQLQCVGERQRGAKRAHPTSQQQPVLSDAEKEKLRTVPDDG